MKHVAEKHGTRTDEYISLHHRIKAKSLRVKQEQAEMKQLLKEFEKKHQAGGRPVFIKTLRFYLDSLNAFEYKKILAGLKEEIQALKSELEETYKIEMDRIKFFKEFVGSPEEHFKSMQETSDKLAQAEKQLQEADAESKKLFIDKDK